MIKEKQFVDKFADIVEKYINKRNMTQESLAFKAELSTITINRLLNRHKKRITAYLLIKVSKALNIPSKEIWDIL